MEAWAPTGSKKHKVQKKTAPWSVSDPSPCSTRVLLGSGWPGPLRGEEQKPQLVSPGSQALAGRGLYIQDSDLGQTRLIITNDAHECDTLYIIFT